jgi:hypothetical protein
MEPYALKPGSRVRITAPQLGGEPLVGTLVGLEPDRILVKRGSSDTPTLIPRSSVVKLEVSGGWKSQAGRGVMIGLGIGAMPGLLLTFGDYNRDTHSSGPNPAAVDVVGAAGGALVGAAIGWALKFEEWQPAEGPAIAAGVAPLQGGGLGVTVRIAWGRGHEHLR